MNEKTFIEEIKKIGINPTQEQLEQLEKYYELLIEWNEKINLTAITEKKSVYLKHFYDSLTLNKIVDLSKINTLCDIGTGAGFPGIVLKIFFPNINMTLVDALNKRINFLSLVVKELKLKNIELIHSRIEEYGKRNREKLDIVTARAVTKLPTLLEYSIPLLKVNGYFVPLKGEVDEELIISQNAFKELNCNLEDKLSFKLPIENSIRNILKIKKIKETSLKYPRLNKLIKNNPL